MDGFVNKVQGARAQRPLRVVSQRSLHSVELARQRSTHRYLCRQRDELLRLLGQAAIEALSETPEGPLERTSLRERAQAVRDMESQIEAVEKRMQRAQMADRLEARGTSPFLTVCACGTPLMPDDATCVVCGRNVEALVQLASESKAQVVTVPCTCGGPLVSGIRFCPECGHSVVDLLKAAGLAVSGDVARCACGEAASPGDRFCSACGKALG